MEKDIHKSRDSQFDKKFLLTENPTLLPPIESWFTTCGTSDPECLSMKEELNAIKGLLNDKPLAHWHKHTRFRNPAGQVKMPRCKMTGLKTYKNFGQAT